jgi:hypothetical protein
MLPVVRLNAIVASLTVSVMYLVLTGLWWLEAKYNFREAIKPYFDPAVAYLALFTLGAVGSLGAYKSLASGLRILLENVRPLRRLIMGPLYVEGTWVGFNMIKNQTYYVVDRYEQSLTGTVTVRGNGWKGIPRQAVARRAHWVSKSGFIESGAGTLSFLSNVSLIEENTSCDAVTLLTFRRKDDRSPPTELHGYSINIIANPLINIMTDIYLSKFSEDTGIDESEALQGAINFSLKWATPC